MKHTQIKRRLNNEEDRITTNRYANRDGELSTRANCNAYTADANCDSTYVNTNSANVYAATYCDCNTCTANRNGDIATDKYAYTYSHHSPYPWQLATQQGLYHCQSV
jgi:hypothetical protein